MSHDPHSKQFEIVRPKVQVDAITHTLDGKNCHVCNLPTETGEDLSRRYCTSRKCNALILD